MIVRLWEQGRDRLIASDPGYVRLRLALSAVLGLVIAIAVLTPFHLPLTVVLVGAVSAMMSALTINDPTKSQQAVTLALAMVVGACTLTVGSLGTAIPPTDNIVFVLLIFVAVYGQRFGPRGMALGSFTFFLFFFCMFLRVQPAQLPMLFVAVATGFASNALVRFVLLPRRVEKELLRIRRAFRARLSAVLNAAINHLHSSDTARSQAALRRANSRLHECVLMIEDSARDLVDKKATEALRRRTIEVELAVQWLSITTERTCAEGLNPAVLAELTTTLRHFKDLIARDPRDVPQISSSSEFSTMLVAGSRLAEHPKPGDELRRAIAELALADVNAQRIAEHDYSAEPEDPPADEPANRTSLFAFDNHTRSAIQAVLGGGIAVVGGELISHQRWYWAVLTVFVVFIGSATAGAMFFKGARRLIGTVVGIFGGVLSATLVAGNTPAILGLIVLCVFGMVYMSRVSQAVMAFFITTMLGLLYSLMGTFSFEVLWIRVAETAVGATAGVLAALVIVPVRTRSKMRGDIEQVLKDLEEFVNEVVKLVSGQENVNAIELARNLDRSVHQVRTTIEPLTHPANVRTSRRNYGWYVRTSLDTIAYRARYVAARAQPGLFLDERRPYAVAERITSNAQTLSDVLRSDGAGPARTLLRDIATPADEDLEDSRQRTVLSGLEHLDASLIALGKAFDVDIDERSATQSVQSPPTLRTSPPEQPDSNHRDPTHPLNNQRDG